MMGGPNCPRGSSVMSPVPPPIPATVVPMVPPTRARNRTAPVPTISSPSYGHRPIPRGYGKIINYFYYY